ncbi:uncharacterized protein [Blastocystis hominis]|uniref:MORN repeat protein n=1 Tax=Blastocystis hominis TaxID=12968 RepID=D8M5A2_BLAHO|nr:uncharacterized protein [Blastocystis hominis]CBK23241.2 unnamed protein product [Blastocystis hominis]|eukprot:XP_012897289.1 uncharacterized protein [Blastocystis hominis]
MVKPVKQQAGYSVDADLRNMSFKEDDVEEGENEESIWNHSILEEFPIMSVNSNEEKAICSIGFPHAGFVLEVGIMDGTFHGSAVIQDTDELVYAMFEYFQGKVNGACKLYYSSGELFFSGYLKDGYRSGRGQEFDKEGNIIFDGLFRNGYKIPQATQMIDKKNYWKEIGSDDRVVSICRKNERGENEGICYFYSRGELERISEWHNDVETRILYKFDGKIMREFIDNVLRYKGEYVQKPSMKIVRQGRGTWYAKDGVKVRYQGDFKRGLYHGKGYCTLGKCEIGEGWMCGIPKSVLWALYILMWILFVVYYLLWALVFPSHWVQFVVVATIFYTIAMFGPIILVMC